MTTIARTVWIDAPRQKVWDVLADFGNVYLTSPNIKKSYLTSEQETGVGTTRHCDLNMMGAQLEERIVGWEEGQSLKINIYEWKNMPIIKSMDAEFTLSDERDGTRLQATMDYQLGMGPLGAMMDAMMMKSQNSKGWAEFLAGIKHYAETGQPVDGSVKLDTSLVMAVA